MTDQHTPGPWVIERRSRHGEKEISRIITPEKDGWGNPLAICSFVSQWGRKDKPANANLIAAAPDLLAALEKMVKEADTHATIDANPVWDFADGPMPEAKARHVDHARAAIAKAKGDEK